MSAAPSAGEVLDDCLVTSGFFASDPIFRFGIADLDRITRVTSVSCRRFEVAVCEIWSRPGIVRHWMMTEAQERE